MKAIVYTADDAEFARIARVLQNRDCFMEIVSAPMDGHKYYDRPYDIAIVALEGAEGMEVVMEYRQRFSGCHVIWITSDEHFAATALRMKVNDFLKRPFDDRELDRSICAAVQNDQR